MNKRNIGIIISYIYFVLNTIIGLFISAYVIRAVGKTNYGIYQAVSSFASYLVLLEFGTGTVMARNISMCIGSNKEDEKNKNATTIWMLTIVLGLFIAVISIVFYQLIDKVYSNSFEYSEILLAKRLFVYVSINLVISFLINTLNGLSLGCENYIFDKVVILAKIIIRTIMLVILLSREANVLYVVQVDAVLSLCNLIVMYLFCKRNLHINFNIKYFSKDLLLSIIPFCLAMLMETFVNTANGNVDKFLIGIMLTPDDVAIYSVSMILFSMYSSIATLPVSLFKPEIARRMKINSNLSSLNDTLIDACRQNIIVTGVLASGILVVGKEFVEIVYGKDYYISWIYSILIIIPLFFNMSNAVIINILDILNKRYIRSIVLLITTIINILLTIVSLKTIGMFGAAMATGFSLIIQTIILNYYYNKNLGIQIRELYIKSYKGILLSLIIAIIFGYVPKAFIHNNIVRFFTCGIIFVTVFCILFYIVGSNMKEKEIINTFLKK